MKKKWVIKDKTGINNSLNCTAIKLLQNLVDLSMNDFKSIYKKSISLVFILFCFNATIAQYNLVNNGSFEDYTICPTAANSQYIEPNYWYAPGEKYFNYFNSCSPDSCLRTPRNCGGGIGNNYQAPKSGNAYIIRSYYYSDTRTYFQSKLKDSLFANHCYYVAFYVNMPNNKKYGCNNIGLLLSNTAVSVDTSVKMFNVLPENPQILNYGNPIITDTMNWVKVSGIYSALGGEQYITLGNFKYDNQTLIKQIQNIGYIGAEYLIDDVSVIPLDSMPLKADAGKDTSIANVGDSVFIGSLTNGITNITWYNSSGAIINTQAPGFYVKPTASTFYVIEQTVCGYYSRDTVNVTVGTVPLKFISYNLVSSLRGTKQSIENIWQTANEINVSHFNIQRSTNGKDFTTIGKLPAQNKLTNEYTFSDSPPLEGLGVVYYRIESVDFDGRKQYSTVQQINTKLQTPNIVLYPNPAKDFVTIESKEIIKQIKVINQVGQIVYSNTINRTSYTLNLTLFSKGLYIVQTTKTNGEVNTQKLTINN